jgi:hypothetical protein
MSSKQTLPDLNAETYPYEAVQHLLDQAAYLNMFSVPDKSMSSALDSGEAGSIEINELLHRFVAFIGSPTRGGAGAIHNTMGERVACFKHRWVFMPDDFRALPGREPPQTPLDDSRSQRFVMLDSICAFDNGRDGFRGFGTGRTYPIALDGKRHLLAAAVGNIEEGFGKFEGHEGTYTYSGTLSRERGFMGNLMCRVVDAEGELRSEGGLPDPQAEAFPETGVIYVVFRGQKKPNQKTSYLFSREGLPEGLYLEPQIRTFHCDFASGREGNPRSITHVGPVIGKLTAYIYFNLLNPGATGTANNPTSFEDYDDYVFFDRSGNEIGGFAFDGGAGGSVGHAAPVPGEGRSFNLKLMGAPGQAALRFGGFGPLVNGRGKFEGVQGMLSHNAAVGISPHALSTVFVARILDPDGRYRAAFNEVDW